MKKGLIALLLALPMAFSSCLNGSGAEPDPVGPGITIYNATHVKWQVALVPADAAIRLAMLLAEAELQHEDWSEVQVDGASLVEKLFSNYATIEQVGTTFRIEFEKSDWYYYSGTVVVETNGTSWGDDDFAWTVSTSGLKASVSNGYTSVSYDYTDGATTRLFEGMGLGIELSEMKVKNAYDTLLDGWSGRFDLEGISSMAYSACKGVEFKMNGNARDAALSWKELNTRYKGVENTWTGRTVGQRLSGEVTCRFASNDYDQKAFPSDWVLIKFSDNGQSHLITYNGTTVPR